MNVTLIETVKWSPFSTLSTSERKGKRSARVARSNGIKENWCCRPAAACNETGCKSAWLPAWLVGWLCVGGTFLLLIVVPLYFSSHLYHFFFSFNHSLSIIYKCAHVLPTLVSLSGNSCTNKLLITHICGEAAPLAKWLGFNSLWSANFLLNCCCAPLPLMMHSHIQLPGSVRWLMDGWTFWDVVIWRAQM